MGTQIATAILALSSRLAKDVRDGHVVNDAMLVNCMTVTCRPRHRASLEHLSLEQRPMLRRSSSIPRRSRLVSLFVTVTLLRPAARRRVIARRATCGIGYIGFMGAWIWPRPTTSCRRHFSACVLSRCRGLGGSLPVVGRFGSFN